MIKADKKTSSTILIISKSAKPPQLFFVFIKNKCQENVCFSILSIFDSSSLMHGVNFDYSSLT